MTPKTLKEFFKLPIKNNKYGVFRVSKIAHRNYKGGYAWQYRFREKGKLYSCTATNLYRLKEKVLQRGWPWVITDKRLFMKSIEKEGLDWSLFE